MTILASQGPGPPFNTLVGIPGYTLVYRVLPWFCIPPGMIIPGLGGYSRPEVLPPWGYTLGLCRVGQKDEKQ